MCDVLRFSVLQALLIISTARIAGGQNIQGWMEPEFQHVSLGDTIAVSLSNFERTNQYLQLHFLKSQELSRWDWYPSYADSVSFIVVDTSTGESIVAGGRRIGLRIDQVYAKDFDYDGNVEVYIAAATGGNHELAAEGGIYELSFGEGGYPKVSEVVYSETVPGLFDVDRDGLWEFATRESCWVSAGGGYASVYGYWARFFEPDTIRGGFVQVNAQLAPYFRDNLDGAIRDYGIKLAAFDASPGERAAIVAGKAAEGVVAWLTASADRKALESWLRGYEAAFRRLSKYTDFEEPDFEDVRAMALGDFDELNSGRLPTRWVPPIERMSPSEVSS